MKGRPPFRRLMPRYPMECGECGHMLDADDASCDKCGHERPPSGWTALSQPRVRLVAVPNPPSIGEMAGDTTGFQVVDEEAAAVPEPTFHTAPSQPSRPSASSHPSQAGIPLRLRMRALPAADEPTEDLDAFDLLGDERGGAVPARLGQDDGGLAPGKTYAGRYRVEEVLPGGPGADRFAAVQEPLVRRVVLTVLKRGRAADAQEALETRFLREASVLARLRHPNLAPVHDFGRAPDGTCFATEEQLYGLPLQYLADRGKLTTTRVAAVAADVASVLCAMHDAGVLHRAIRSEHVVVAPRTWRDGAGETAQVGRCGLEVTPEDAAALTDAEAALVVPPEVLAGQEPDELADIYAVGVLLYRALAGRPPYEGDAAAVLAARREGDPAPLLRKGDGSLDDRLADVAERCLLAAPDQRFPDARALLGALEALLAAPPEPVVAPAPSPPPAPAPRGLSWQGVVAAALAGALAPTLGLLALVATGAWKPQAPAEGPAITVVPLTPAAPPVAVTGPPASAAAPAVEEAPAVAEVPAAPVEPAPAPKAQPAPKPAASPAPSATRPATPSKPASPAATKAAADSASPVPVAAPEPKVEPEAKPEPKAAVAPPPPEPTAAPEVPAGSIVPGAKELSGLWLGKANGSSLVLDLTIDDAGRVSGRIKRSDPGTEGTVRGRVNKSEAGLQLELQVTEGDVTTTYSGLVIDGEFRGRMYAGGKSLGKVTARR